MIHRFEIIVIGAGLNIMLAEEKYYPSVEAYIKKKFNCVKTGTTKGSTSLGYVDVIGAYETSSQYYTDIEVIVVEVKTTTKSFGKSLGQALGYSIYGERCYLAVVFNEDETFSDEQQYMANHLGVGLIRVLVDSYGKPKISKVEMVLNSKKHDSILGQKLYLLHSIGITKCYHCNLYKNKEEMFEIKRKVDSLTLFSKLGIRKTYLCKECYTTVIPEKERVKKDILLAAGKKAAKTRKFKEAARKAVETRKAKSIDGGVSTNEVS